MASNRYYIIQLPTAEARAGFLQHAVQSEQSARKSLDGSKMLVKLPVGADVPENFVALTEYSHSEILVELAGVEWTSPDVI